MALGQYGPVRSIASMILDYPGLGQSSWPGEITETADSCQCHRQLHTEHSAK